MRPSATRLRSAASFLRDEQFAALLILAKWVTLGSAIGILAGVASAVFLVTLKWATDIRAATPGLLFALPVAGFIVGWVYHRMAGDASRGNNLVIDELHISRARIPFRMAPLVLFGTIITHLFGGSAGREGTAIQMGASLADSVRRLLNRLTPISDTDRRLMIMAGVSGGFGSVFGTPLAGFIFALEVQSIGRIWYDGAVPCLVAAVVGDIVTDRLINAVGITHSHYPALPDLALSPGLAFKIAIGGFICGLVSLVFVELTHFIKRSAARTLRWAPLRPALGGVAIIGLTLLVGTTDYNGLSLPLIQRSVTTGDVIVYAFALKLLFTAVTLGTGFMGGEVTPLFVIGATLGAALGRLLGIEPNIMASVGLVAVFAGASNTPLACTLMGIELFGGGGAIYQALGCYVAYLASGHRSIYITQRIAVPKTAGEASGRSIELESVEAYAERTHASR
jgi:H+/Cl- antiporter ClcA